MAEGGNGDGRHFAGCCASLHGLAMAFDDFICPPAPGPARAMYAPHSAHATGLHNSHASPGAKQQ